MKVATNNVIVIQLDSENDLTIKPGTLIEIDPKMSIAPNTFVGVYNDVKFDINSEEYNHIN